MRKFLLPSLFVLFLTCAVYGQDQVQIIHADYGADGAWVDVTAQVQSLVHGEGLNFRVDQDNLRTDPAPHRKKTLRLQVRNSRGQVQTLMYREKTVVRLYVARDYISPVYGTPPPGSPGPRNSYGQENQRGLEITRAEYGAGPRVRDVTGRLASMVRGDHLSVRVSNDSMGGDPAEDRRKTLTVWYIYNGRAGQAIANEQEVIDLPGPADSHFYYQSHLRIMRAQYGADYRFVDVTDQLNSQIERDSLNLRVTNEAMGGDPAPGERKVLTVFYVFNGRSGRVFANENENVTLPAAAENVRDDDDSYYHRYWGSGSYGELRILHATWGERDRQDDVTSRLAAFLHGNHLEMPVTNDAMGGDPAHGSIKYLRVIYLWHGLRYEVNVPEGQVLNIP